MFYNTLKNKNSLALLIDPDKFSVNHYKYILEKAENYNFSVVFVGGSLVFRDINSIIKKIKKITELPVFIFPGSFYQISKYADGILYTCLISGRNPEFLISQQVISAPFIKKSNLEVISTGYILVDSGKRSSVEYISHTFPIPANKFDIILATCFAAELIGFKSVYLEGGSGAKVPISLKIIKKLKKHISIPIIVGGGINNIKQAEMYLKCGANLVVIGTALEKFKNNFFNRV